MHGPIHSSIHGLENTAVLTAVPEKVERGQEVIRGERIYRDIVDVVRADLLFNGIRGWQRVRPADTTVD